MNIHIFATFCALFLAQPLFIHAKPEPNDLQRAEIRDGVANAADDIFHKLMAVIDKALDDASHTLDAAVDAVNKTVINLEGKAHHAINSAMEPINAKLKECVKEAMAIGSNITKCQNYVDDLTNLPINLYDDMSDCMTNKLFQATSYVDTVLADFKVIEQAMANFTTRIAECRKESFWTELECLAHLTGEMAKDSIQVPIEIAATVTKTVLLIQSLIPQVGACYSVSLAKVPIQGLSLVGKFSVCVGIL